MAAPRVSVQAMKGRGVPRSSIVNGVGAGINIATVILVTPGLLHTLGADAFGSLLLAITLVGIGGLIGGESAVSHLYAAESSLEGWWPAALTTMAAVAATSALAVGAIGLLLGLSGHPSMGLVLTISAGGVAFNVARAPLRGVMIGAHAFGRANLAMAATSALTWTGPWVAAYLLHWSLDGAVASLVLASAAGWLIHLAVSRPMVRTISSGTFWVGSQANFSRYFKIWGASTAVAGSEQLFSSADRFVVAAALGTTGVAYYSIATSIAAKASSILSAVWQPLLPQYAALLRVTPEHTDSAPDLGRSTVYAVTANALVALTSIFAAPAALNLWLGSVAASRLIAPLDVVIAIYALYAVAAPAYFALCGLGELWLCAAIAAVGASLSLMLIWALGTTFGLTGAAAGNAGYLVVLSLIPLALRRRQRVLTYAQSSHPNSVDQHSTVPPAD